MYTNKYKAKLQVKNLNRTKKEEIEAWIALFVKKINEDKANGRNI